MSDQKLAFMIYDASPFWMERFVGIIESMRARPIPVSVSVADDWANFQSVANVPAGADFGYYVVPQPNSPYLRCFVFCEEMLGEYLAETIRDICLISFSTVRDMAIRTAAEHIPPLMRERSLETGGEPLVLEGDPVHGGIAALRRLLIDTDDEDLTPEDAENPYTIFRQGDAVVLTFAFEIGSLDPFVIMVIYGSPAARKQLKRTFDEAQAKAGPPPDRRGPVQREARRLAEAAAVKPFDFGGLDGGHNILAMPSRGRA